MPGPRRDVERRLDDPEIDAAIDAAQRSGDAYLVRRLCFVKNLYAGDTLTEAAGRVGISQPTASRWTAAWNEAGVTGLEPAFGGGRPPKLSTDQRERLAHLLDTHRPLTMGQIATLVEEGFGVAYSQRHLARIIDDLVDEYGIDRPVRAERAPAGSESPADNLRAALDDLGIEDAEGTH
ncbi:Transposase [Halanaeroarchaeum sp. HSR-CO]|uniref:helix-turn-helix domain-containing protein n=1 Tax=Halanaeroarchaeum sp. HSR-CO TaxID=2866382 RepID=UPI00217D06FC|nr:helix-turn-helix domain-containing protein [Halanaeroarchaeum sp. HSR-CO]UWG46741.1 Transposase [Halanaeroarchaeum sp. HSR-CO]